MPLAKMRLRRLLRLLNVYQVDHFVEAPNMIANPCFHRWRHAQTLVNPAEIAVHEVGRQRVLK
jgi:hypothetical protein